ncbi:transcriptional regulator, GntR family [Friedmanniella luteola]|uniref:Transcriptional regulator, GntR family n=1 Tax=Friedmanniella luteola TaxID=546871 RepID=A0A1H1ZE86_9ACTN|nr:FadR/GntR family transcriptional regulator [Friedmanniella luteola]SDT32101.1 transcriptional regulator, GntR family [Friedmanniella luteola]
MPLPPPTDPAAASLGGSIASTSVVTEVTRRLLDHFTSGTVAPGSRLPPERRLAETFAVGRSAVREALAALEVLGVVEVRPGSGTYLRSSTSELLPQTLSWGMLLGEPKTRELVQVRHGLEVQAARLAATAADEAGLTALAGHLAAMRAAASDFEAFAAADLRFHQELAEQTGNVLLDQMLQSVRSLIRVWVERAVSDAEHVAVTCTEHADVLTALEGRDPVAAAAAMSAHMDSAGARLLATVEAGA